MDKPDIKAAFGLPPEKAIEYFRSKGYAITWDWRELWQEQQAKAFTVAKVMNNDVLEDIRASVDDAIANGTTLRDFRKNLTPILQSKGWWGTTDHVNTETGEATTAQLGSPRRLRTIYQTNVQTAYMAGRYRRQMESADSHPWWMYVAILDGRTRPMHRAMNGRTYRFDDPFWNSFYPPNGFNCRCRVRALADSALKSEGIQPQSSDGKIIDHVIHMKDGTSVPVKALRVKVDGQDKLFYPDAGWSYNPGQSVFGNDAEVMRKITAQQDRAIRVQAVQALNNSELRHQVFANWVKDELAKRQPGNDAQVVGFVNEDVADFAKKHNGGNDPARVLAIPAKRLVHADSPKHREDGIALTQEELQALPAVVAKPAAVYWDTQEQDVVYTGAEQDGHVAYLPARLNYSVKKLGRMDVLVNAYKVEAGRMNSARYIKMGAP